MSGIDKIMAYLNSDCDAECKAITEKAEEKANAIINDASVQGEQKKQEIIANAEKQAEEIKRLAVSTADMKGRQSLLSQKVNLLNKVLNDALESLNAMSGDEYFNILSELAVKNAQVGDGELCVSKADGDSLPDNFIENINKKLQGKGKLTKKVSDTMNKKGVILIYGDIEINLTFEALIESDADELKETAQKILFK